MSNTAANGERGIGVLVDAHSSVVWASMPPVTVDGESWTILLWYLQEQGKMVQLSPSTVTGGMLDHLAVVSARARHRVGEHRERWRASDSRGLDDVEGQRHPST